MTRSRLLVGDVQVVDALRAGDEVAFRALVAELQPSMMRLARSFVQDASIAEEVVQDTWLAVVRGLDRFEGRASLKTWILRILVNRARTTGVRERRASPDVPVPTPDRFRPDEDSVHPGHWVEPPARWGDDPERALLNREAMQQLRRAVDQLPPRQREVLMLRDVEGLTAEEACNVLGIRETNQRVLLHRARAKIREALAAYFAEEDR